MPRSECFKVPAWAATLSLLLLASSSCLAATPAAEAIFRLGVLPSGAPLTGRRAPDLTVSGIDAACASCHRRSGLGEKEGLVNIPPISGIYLFHPRAHDGDDLDLPFVETMRPDRDPYTEAKLARAIRQGIAADGSKLSYLMPRYNLNDADMAALIDYLKHLTPSTVPGVTDSVLHFATIITPDADPISRKGMLDVLQHFFADKNAFARAETARMRSSHRMMFKANRRWLLHVWELTGPPEEWQAQLQDHLAREPVFAVISGLGGAHWEPVHHFCEHAALPCLFPNVELPVVAEEDFYNLYFSRGVLLEADLLAQRLTEEGAGSPARRRVIQVYRSGDIGQLAARALTGALGEARFESVERELKTSQTTPDTALGDVGPDDTVILWLRAPDLLLLGSIPVPTQRVFLSGEMGGLGKAPLPPEWRRVAHMAYPFDLPELRRVRMDYPLGWFSIRSIPVVDEQVQSDTYLACGLLAETLSHMSDSFIRDYLVERMEGLLEHRIVTGYYPRLSLAPRQRFASKGGYMVRFADSGNSRVVAESRWLTP